MTPVLTLRANLKAAVVSLIVFAGSLAAAVTVGASDVGFLDVLRLLQQQLTGVVADAEATLTRTIIFDLRIPRVAVVALCGAALSAAGVISQGLFRNSLASPSILGIEAAGTLAAVLAFYLGSAWAHTLALPAAAFLGALAAAGFVFAAVASRALATTETLLLAGFALNALLGAATSLVVSLVLENYQTASAVMHWLLGGFAAKGWEHAAIGGPPIIVALIAAFRLAPRLDVLSFGEGVATSLSLDVRRLKISAIVLIAALVGSAVSIGGAIPFVGLLVPHLTRLVTGPRHKRLLWFSIVNGMSLLLLADLVARTVRAPAELEIGILTSLLGAPFFIALLLRQTRGDVPG